MKRFSAHLILSVLIFFICGAPTITFRVLRPSVIDVPGYINSVAVIDRSVLSKSSEAILEGNLTGELPESDKVASFHALEGLVETLQNSGKYNVIRTSKNLVKNAAPESFPEQLQPVVAL